MRLYIVNYTNKEGKTFKKAILKLSNDLSGESVFYSGFIQELESERSWGKSGWLEATSELRKDNNERSTATFNKGGDKK